MRVLVSFCFSLFFRCCRGSETNATRRAYVSSASKWTTPVTTIWPWRTTKARIHSTSLWPSKVCSNACHHHLFFPFFFFFVLNNENEQARARVAFRSGTSHPVNVSSIKDFQGIHIKGARQASQEGPVLYCDCIQWRVWCCFFLLFLLVVYWD